MLDIDLIQMEEVLGIVENTEKLYPFQPGTSSDSPGHKAFLELNRRWRMRALYITDGWQIVAPLIRRASRELTAETGRSVRSATHKEACYELLIRWMLKKERGEVEDTKVIES